MCVFDHVKKCTPEALANVTDGTMLKVKMLIQWWIQKLDRSETRYVMLTWPPWQPSFCDSELFCRIGSMTPWHSWPPLDPLLDSRKF